MNRALASAVSLAILLLCIAPICLADNSTEVTGHYYDGDNPPPGSIVAREQKGFNHIGVMGENGKVYDTIPYNMAPGKGGPRYDDQTGALTYQQWKTEDGSTSKGAWVPDLTDAQRHAVCETVKNNLRGTDYQLYPDNRGPDSYNCAGVPIKSYGDCSLSLPITDKPELTPTELFFDLSGVRMHGLQRFDLVPDGETSTLTFGLLGDNWNLEIQVEITHDGVIALENLLKNLLGRGGTSGSPGGPSSAGGGGIESRPLWLGRSEVREESCALAVSASPLLEQLLPLSGPNGESRVQVEPRNVVGGSNAIAATGMDYLSAPGVIAASIFGAETANSIYEHDYQVCSRVRLSEIDAVIPIRYNGRCWWTIRAHNDAENCDELSIPISIVLNGSQAVVDSRYIVENYAPGIAGTALNYQIRANEIGTALRYLDNITGKLAETHTVAYSNTTRSVSPTVFAHTAEYQDGSIRLDMGNLGEAAMVRFSGPVWPEPRRESETTVEFNLEVPAGRSVVNLPVGYIHDAVIYIEAEGFTDKVYVAGGYWFAWDDKASGGASSVSMTTGPLQHSPLPGAATWSVSPPLAEMTGSVSDVLSWGHVGLGYSFRQAATPIDISDADSVAFWLKGDGKQYRVKLESASVLDNDFHGFTFTAPTEWQVVRIPFTEFAQEGWGAPVAWTGTDIRTISFVTVGRPHESVHLFVDRISFLQAGGRTDLIDPTKRAANGSDSAIFGATVTAVFGDTFYVESADRSSGIRVSKADHGLHEDDTVDLGGIMMTAADGERCVEASCAKKVGTGHVEPVGMNIRALGGTDHWYDLLSGAGQQGVTDPFGLNNIGLLVRVWGRLTHPDSSSFILTDGSRAELKCTIPEGVSLDPGWSHLSVTGISSCYVDGPYTRRMLRVRNQADLLPL